MTAAERVALRAQHAEVGLTQFEARPRDSVFAWCLDATYDGHRVTVVAETSEAISRLFAGLLNAAPELLDAVDERDRLRAAASETGLTVAILHVALSTALPHLPGDMRDEFARLLGAPGNRPPADALALLTERDRLLKMLFTAWYYLPFDDEPDLWEQLGELFSDEPLRVRLGLTEKTVRDV